MMMYIEIYISTEDRMIMQHDVTRVGDQAPGLHFTMPSELAGSIANP